MIFLNDHGYEGTSVLDAINAYNAMYHTKFDLIISDIMMPDIDGFEFAETIRESDKAIPILFMTAIDDMSPKSKGYRMGIDDYMVKPINFEELPLHIGALLRRAGIINNRILALGNMVMNGDEMTVTINGENRPVTVQEFNILFNLYSAFANCSTI